LAQPL